MLNDDFEKGVLGKDGSEWTRFPIKITEDQITKVVAYFQKVSLYIAKALQIITESNVWREKLRWKDDCCVQSIKILNEAGVLLWTDKSGNSVMEWFASFRKKRTFKNPLIENQRYGPPFLRDNPQSAFRIRKWGNEALLNADLTIEGMRDYIIYKEIPLVAQDLEISVSELKQNYGLYKICLKTVDNWMLYLFFRGHPHKKVRIVFNEQTKNKTKFELTTILFKINRRDVLRTSITGPRTLPPTLSIVWIYSLTRTSNLLAGSS